MGLEHDKWFSRFEGSLECAPLREIKGCRCGLARVTFRTAAPGTLGGTGELMEGECRCRQGVVSSWQAKWRTRSSWGREVRWQSRSRLRLSRCRVGEDQEETFSTEEFQGCSGQTLGMPNKNRAGAPEIRAGAESLLVTALPLLVRVMATPAWTRLLMLIQVGPVWKDKQHTYGHHPGSVAPPLAVRPWVLRFSSLCLPFLPLGIGGSQ